MSTDLEALYPATRLAAVADAVPDTGLGALLPVLGVYKPIWKYDLETLGKDLSAHLVFGTATAAAFRLLAHVGR